MNDIALLASQVGVNERTLRRAVNEGTLRGRRLSPRRLKLSAAEKEYVLNRWDLLATLRQALRTEPNVRFALLFGSTARGDDTDESDIDLLVEMREASFDRRIDLAMKLEQLIGRKVQVLALEDVGSNHLLLAEALREGRVIVDRENRWQQYSEEKGYREGRARAQYNSQKRRALAGIERLLAQGR
jgi:predicted nucleotidyltransferase